MIMLQAVCRLPISVDYVLHIRTTAYESIRDTRGCDHQKVADPQVSTRLQAACPGLCGRLTV